MITEEIKYTAFNVMANDEWTLINYGIQIQLCACKIVHIGLIWYI